MGTGHLFLNIGRYLHKIIDISISINYKERYILAYFLTKT